MKTLHIRYFPASRAKILSILAISKKSKLFFFLRQDFFFPQKIASTMIGGMLSHPPKPETSIFDRASKNKIQLLNKWHLVQFFFQMGQVFLTVLSNKCNFLSQKGG